MKNRSPKKIKKWLGTMPTLTELCSVYPEEWAVIEQDISAAFESGKKEDIHALLDRSSEIGKTLKKSTPRNKKGQSGRIIEEYKTLSKLVLPPELNAAVYVFRRKNKNLNNQILLPPVQKLTDPSSTVETKWPNQ